MSNNMILVFNQLTRSELADCNLFENILDLHYEKFKFFYSLIQDTFLSNIQKITCQEKMTELLIFIQFKSKKSRDSFNKILDEKISISDYKYFKYFNIEINKEGNKLNISIENKNICRESDIYEN